MKSKFFEAVVSSACILAAAFLGVGILAYVGLDKVVNQERLVHVRGLSTREVLADKAFWDLSYTVLGNDVGQIYQDLHSKDSLIVDFLVANGIPGEDISTTAPTFDNLDMDSYRENKSGFRYSGYSRLMIVTNQVERIRSLQRDIMQLSKLGVVFNSNSADYEFSDLNRIKPQMIEEATRNARSAALKFAEDSDSKLGKIKSASQGVFSIGPRDEISPQFKIVRVVTTVDFFLED